METGKPSFAEKLQERINEFLLTPFARDFNEKNFMARSGNSSSSSKFSLKHLVIEILKQLIDQDKDFCLKHVFLIFSDLSNENGLKLHFIHRQATKMIFCENHLFNKMRDNFNLFILTIIMLNGIVFKLN